jgi:hypothetical protein
MHSTSKWRYISSHSSELTTDRFVTLAKDRLIEEVNMSSELLEQITLEIERIKQLPLSEQPSAFAALRDLLETTLNSADGN